MVASWRSSAEPDRGGRAVVAIAHVETGALGCRRTWSSSFFLAAFCVALPRPTTPIPYPSTPCLFSRMLHVCGVLPVLPLSICLTCFRSPVAVA